MAPKSFFDLCIGSVPADVDEDIIKASNEKGIQGEAANIEGEAPQKSKSLIRRPIDALKHFEEGMHNRNSIAVFDGVTLPLGFIGRLHNVRFLGKTNVDVVKYLTGITSPDKVLEELITSKEEKPGMEQTERSEIWRNAFSIIENNVIKSDRNSADPAEGYLYFGNQDYRKILKLICQVNPFFASALTLSSDKENLELIAYKDTPPASSDSLYLKLIRNLSIDKPYHQINVYFTKDMDIRMMKKYDANGEGTVVPETEWDYYASAVLYNFVFYASSIHATIHVLHYLMCAGMSSSCRHNKKLAAWAAPYDDNITIKYVEVAALLLDAKFHGKVFGPPDDKVLTGKNGLGGSTALMPDLRELLCLWGTFKDSDDYMKKFMVKNIHDEMGGDYSKTEAVLDKFGILVQFRKSIANVKPFAEDLVVAMKKDSSTHYHKAELRLKNFMSACGKGVSSIDSFSSWIQLMSVTGITHGSTLSYSRLVATPEIMRWRNPDNKYWDHHDLSLTSAGIGTIQGVIEERHVYTSDHKVKKNVSSRVQAVLDKYDSEAGVIKDEYQKSITSRSDFREFGWILTDWCQDGFDGKHQTIATYI